MYRTQIVCLGHKEILTDNYQSIDELKNVVFAKFQNYLVRKNMKKTPIKFILTYKDETTGQEELLRSMTVIINTKKTLFRLSVKRIWDSCCACLSSFGIISERLPCECQGPDCGYQYCNECVESIKKCNSNKNRQFYCMYCNYSSAEGPQENDFLTDLLWEHFYKKYGVKLLSGINSLPGALSNDISCRLTHIQCLVETLKKRKSNASSIPDQIKSIIDRGIQIINDLKEIKKTSDEIKLKESDGNDFEICYNKYLCLLNGEHGANRECENFIEICEMLLYYIEQTDFEKYFPSLNNLMNNWEHSLMTEDIFKPKVIHVFKSFEEDLKKIIIQNIPCRIGFIGETSVGKTSLLNCLRNIVDNSMDNLEIETSSNIKIISPVRVGQSTLCQLEFDHQYTNDRNVIFVDIEGSTDYDIDLKSGNYFDEIKKADCDLYILVFEHKLTDIHKNWYNYIVNTLHRTCWFVRNKIDDLFLRTFQEDIGQDFNSSSEIKKNQFSERIIRRIRESVSYDIHGEKLSNLYLTFSSSNTNDFNRNLSKISYGKFDLEQLINDIKNLPLSFHKSRLQKLSMNATAKIINTCFRRGYVINVLKYQIYAGVAAVLPFADLIPRYVGREKIRQIFGINNRSRFMAWWTGEKEELKDYLKNFNIEIDENSFKTSAFKKTFALKRTAIEPTINAGTSAIIRPIAATGLAGVSISDDIIRISGIGAVNAIRGLSISLIIVGVALTAAMCAWSAVSNGKQMYNYLNRLCDDIILISGPIAMKIIEDKNDTHESCTIENK